LLMHFNGTSWVVSQDTFENADLYSISMVSATDGWASGSLGGRMFMLHYTGGHWRDATDSVDAPHPKITLATLRMASATSGWAFGQDEAISADGPLPTQLFQYRKVGATYRWELVLRFLSHHVNALSVLTDRAAWMVGQSGQMTVIVRVTTTYLN